VAYALGLSPRAELLAVAVLLDVVLGDPDYGWHPVRLIGSTISVCERMLRRVGFEGRAGGVLLFFIVATVWAGGLSIAVVGAGSASRWVRAALHGFVLYSMLALGSLLRHGRRIEDALREDDVAAARQAVSRLVGRDTQPMDAAACRRAAVESLSENLTDGVVSPLFWYAVGGLPLLVLFKVVSTMDSMVGYKTPEYVHFGWCGARLDDAMNFIPARITWLIIAAAATILPGYSGMKALRHGLSDHGVLPSPNSGWSEAAAAGGLQRRLVGPIWSHGALVTDVWIGAASDPPLGTDTDYDRAAALVAVSGLFAAAVAVAAVLTAWR